MKYLLLNFVFPFFFLSVLNAQSANLTKDNDIIEAGAISGLDDHLSSGKVKFDNKSGRYIPQQACLDDTEGCLDALNKFREELRKRRNDPYDDEDKKRREKMEKECTKALDSFEKTKSEMIELCTVGSNCEKEITKCLECQENPELCVLDFEDEENTKKKDPNQLRLENAEEKYKLCPIIAAQAVDKAKEEYEKLKEKKEEKTQDVNETQQELITSINENKVTIEEMQGELLELQNTLTEAYEEKANAIINTEQKIKDNITKIENEIQNQIQSQNQSALEYQNEEEKINEIEDKLKLNCADFANSALEANRNKSYSALQNNKALLSNTNEFLSKASQKLSTNQNLQFQIEYNKCLNRDFKSAVNKAAIKRKRKNIKNIYNSKLKALADNIKRLRAEKSRQAESAGIAVKQAAQKADRNITKIQNSIIKLQQKIASKEQENQMKMATKAQKLIQDQKQLTNLAREHDFAQRFYELHAKHSNGESAEPGEITKAILKYREALNDAETAIRACSNDEGDRYGDCSKAVSFIDRSDLRSTMPNSHNCEEKGRGKTNGGQHNNATQ